MARRGHKDPGHRSCKCDKCNAESHSKPGTTHRRCSSEVDMAIRPKRDKLPGVHRGTWQ